MFATRTLSNLWLYFRFTTGHIWACPPSEGDDYIFHCHPADQKIPKPKRLQEWYKKMLDKAVAERIVHDYKVRIGLSCVNHLLSQLLNGVLYSMYIYKGFKKYQSFLSLCRTSSSRRQRIVSLVPKSCLILRVTSGPMCLRRALRSWSRRKRRENGRRTVLPVKV